MLVDKNFSGLTINFQVITQDEGIARGQVLMHSLCDISPPTQSFCYAVTKSVD